MQKIRKEGRICYLKASTCYFVHTFDNYKIQITVKVIHYKIVVKKKIENG